MNKQNNRLLIQKLFEIVSLYIVFPLLFVLNVFRFPVMIALIPMGIIIFIFLRNDKSFDNKQFNNWEQGKKHIKRMLLLFIVSALVMLGTILIVNPSDAFYLIHEKPWLMLIISIFYPLFSVIPQALAYRALFFHRYADLFHGKWLQLIVSALLFSFGHILYENWLVLLLTFVAGIIYGYRYQASKSLTLSILEHSLYGVWLFASGLGMFFISHRVV